MIRWILKLFFGKELNQMRKEIAEEGRELLKEARTKYIQFERVQINTPEFLYEMFPVYDNKSFISWLSETRLQWDKMSKELIEAGERDKGLYALAKSSLVDGLFEDLQTFKNSYNQMIEEKDGNTVQE